MQEEYSSSGRPPLRQPHGMGRTSVHPTLPDLWLPFFLVEGFCPRRRRRSGVALTRGRRCVQALTICLAAVLLCCKLGTLRSDAAAPSEVKPNVHPRLGQCSNQGR